METIKTSINLDEIRDFFKVHCEEENILFSEFELEKFIRFLEIDFNDWLRENMRSFIKNS